MDSRLRGNDVMWRMAWQPGSRRTPGWRLSCWGFAEGSRFRRNDVMWRTACRPGSRLSPGWRLLTLRIRRRFAVSQEWRDVADGVPAWVPAYAGMTASHAEDSPRVRGFAGMTWCGGRRAGLGPGLRRDDGF